MEFINNTKAWLYVSKQDTKKMKNNTILFKVQKENLNLLLDWAFYRQLILTRNLQDLREVCRRDLIDNGNSPEFRRFVSFNPNDASDDFLLLWLSWFGISPPKKRAKRICSILLHTLLRQKTIISYEQILWKTKFFNKHNKLLDYLLNFVYLLPRKTKKRMIKKRKTIQNRRSQNYKLFLAYVFGTTAVLTPIVINTVSKKYNFLVDWNEVDIKRTDSKTGMVQDFKLVGNTIIHNLVRNSATVGIPLVILFTVNKYTNKIPKNIYAAITKDIVKKNKIPENTIQALIEKNTLAAQLLTHVVLPTVNESIKTPNK
jgi:hypothetical protein